jgi:hypothetical protein
MGTWSRDELESAFERYQELAADAGRTGNWKTWAELFTDDAVYVEHHYGTFTGREAISDWISSCMSEYPGSAMSEFPIDWYLIDQERGWVVCQVWNRMEDPGDGTTHEAYNFTLLKYAGDGRWSYEEDVYNPMRFGAMVAEWEAAKQAASSLG